MPGTDPVSIAGAKDKIVLMDTQGVGFFVYQDLIKAGQRELFSSTEICIIQIQILTSAICSESRCRGRTESSLRHDPFQPGSRTGEK